VCGVPGGGGRRRLRPHPGALLRRRQVVRRLLPDDRRGGPGPARTSGRGTRPRTQLGQVKAAPESGVVRGRPTPPLVEKAERTMTNAAGKHLEEVRVASLPIEPLHRVLDREESTQLDRDTETARKLLAGRVVWNVNSTAVGGGVAEMLQSLLAYVRGAGIDARWLVIRGDKPFFRVTKRLHNFLHGDPGDGGALGAAERRAYRATI